ncbi:hypothetical protein ACSVBT_02080 [Afipia sp. TerB]
MRTSKLLFRLQLWAGLWAGSLIWAVNIQLGQILPSIDCRSQSHLSAIASIVCGTIAALTVAASWRSARGLSDHTVLFMSGISSLSGAVFTFALIMQALASMVLTGCER